MGSFFTTVPPGKLLKGKPGQISTHAHQKKKKRENPSQQEEEDFPAGTVGKNPPVNAGDMSSILGQGRQHKPEQLCPCAPTAEANGPSACASQQKSPQWEGHKLQLQ